MKSFNSDWTVGIAVGLASAVAFGLMGFLVHQASKYAPIEEVAFFRCIVSVLLLTPIVLKEIPHLFKSASYILWIRALGGAISVYCFFTNLGNLAVVDAIAIANTSPFFVVLISYLFLGERLQRVAILGLIAVFTGAFILQTPSGSAISHSALAIGLIGATAASAAYLALKRAAKAFSPPLIVWTFSTMTVLVTLTIPGKSWIYSGTPLQLSLLGVGVFGLIGQLLMTKAYLLLPSSVAATLGLTAILWGGLCDAIFFSVVPSGVSIAGYLALLIGVVFLNKKPLVIKQNEIIT